jgi:hypothetical protein
MTDQTLHPPAHLRLVPARPSRDPFVSAVQVAKHDLWCLVELAQNTRKLRDAGAPLETGYAAVTALLGELMGIANDLDVALAEAHA